MRLINGLTIVGWLAVVGWNWYASRIAQPDGPAPQLRRPPILLPAAPQPPLTGLSLVPAGRSDPGFDVEVPPLVGDASGTAFAVDAPGKWITARHVVAGCAQVYLRRGERWVPVQVAWYHPRADLVVLVGPANFAMLSVVEGPLYPDQPGFGVGYPRGMPGAVAGALLGRSTMRMSGRFSGNTPVTTWAETLRDPPDPDATLGGISGGPMLNANGQLIGVVVAASIRRGRFHATAPELLADAGIRPVLGAATASAIDASNYVAAAARLRQQQAVLQAGCKAPRVKPS